MIMKKEVGSEEENINGNLIGWLPKLVKGAVC